MIKVVGIGEYAVSSNEVDVIKTFALGSCVALVLYSPKIKKLGMVHIALPDSKILNNGNDKPEKPGYFADVAVPLIFNMVCGGFSNCNEDFKVSIFGGSLSRDKKDIFNIGQKNIAKVKEILFQNNISLNYSNIGGYFSRTIEVDVMTGNLNMTKYPIKI